MLAMVAAIFEAMWPDLPIPVTMTLPLQERRMRQASSKASVSMYCLMPWSALISSSRTLMPVLRNEKLLLSIFFWTGQPGPALPSSGWQA